jgi:hypothetical protein
MSLKDELAARLPSDVRVVNINREANLNGLDAVEVEVTVPGTQRTLTCTFARNNGLSDIQIAELVRKKVLSIVKELL